MPLRFIDWIWHFGGSLALAPGQSADDAFDRLDPLFRQYGTSHERTDDTLTFRKKDQAAQDKMSIFDSGVLHVEKGAAAPVLRYHLISRTLLFCFLAPLLFLGLAQLTVVLGKLEKSPTAAEKKAEEEKKKAEAKKPDVALNPIDKFLGAPPPKTKKEKEEEKKKKQEDDKKPSPTPGYVFAAIFATLYLAGRVLEDRLVKKLFKKSLLGS